MCSLQIRSGHNALRIMAARTPEALRTQVDVDVAKALKIIMAHALSRVAHWILARVCLLAAQVPIALRSVSRTLLPMGSMPRQSLGSLGNLHVGVQIAGLRRSILVIV